MNSKELKVWKCEKCGRTFIDKSVADKCCEEKSEIKRFCEDCGKEIDKKWYRNFCSRCAEIRKYNKCHKMTLEEYEKEFPDNMVVYNDNFYESVQDVLEHCYDNSQDIPSYVYGTRKKYITLDISNAIEQALEDVYEDAEFDNVDELYEFVEKWNERNSLVCYEECNIAIEIPEELKNKYLS